MAGYIGVSIEDDPDVLTTEILQALVDAHPGFVAREAHLEVTLLEVVARVVSETRYLFNLIPDTIFQYFGESLLGLAPVSGAPPVAFTDWVMLDSAGYTIPAGTHVAYQVTGDTLRVFATTEERTVDPGFTTAFNVPIQAIAEGTVNNGLAAGELQLVDSLAYVSSVTATTATSGGADAETSAEYLSRLSDEMQLLTPRFVLAKDAAILARRVPGVYRAVAIDNYDPVTETFDNEKMITVSVVGEDGLALGDPVKAAVEAYLESLREVNFIVHVIDPSYTEINVNFVVVANEGYDLVDLESRATQAVASYLSPARWAGGDETPPTWKASHNVVRYLEVAEVLNRVAGVDYVQSLTLNGSPADVAMADVAALTSVGTINGSAISA